MDAKSPIHIELADKMPYDRWYAYMLSSMIVLNLESSHYICTNDGKSYLKPKPSWLLANS